MDVIGPATLPDTPITRVTITFNGLQKNRRIHSHANTPMPMRSISFRASIYVGQCRVLSLTPHLNHQTMTPAKSGQTLVGIGEVTRGMRLTLGSDQRLGSPALEGSFTLLHAHDPSLLERHLGDLVSHRTFELVQAALPRSGDSGTFENVHQVLMNALPHPDPTHMHIINSALFHPSQWGEEPIGADPPKSPGEKCSWPSVPECTGDQCSCPTRYFYVIDMQNDFIDAVVEGLHGPELPDGKGHIGAFAVSGSNGKLCDDVAAFINTHSNCKKAHFVVSRDYHPVNHCSFSKLLVTNGLASAEWSKAESAKTTETIPQAKIDEWTDNGPYPPHCIQGSVGAEIQSTVFAALNKDDVNVHVTFKGWHKDYDSYANHAYHAANGRKIAHNVPRAKGSTDPPFTGGWFVPGAQKSWLTYNGAFNTEVLNTGQPFKPDKVDGVTFANATEFYVFGLAGNFCVQDTAINLKHAYPKNKVTVINDLTRYVDDSDASKGSLQRICTRPIRFDLSKTDDADHKNTWQHYHVNGVEVDWGTLATGGELLAMGAASSYVIPLPK